MQITSSSLATGTGPGQWFTGDVYVDTHPTHHTVTPAGRVGGSTPGARTAWHTHR